MIRVLGTALNGLARLSPRLAGALAVRLFVTPRRVPMRPQTAAFLDSSDRHYLTGPGGHELAAYRFRPKPVADAADPARAPRVLLVHGWESHAGRWVPLIRALRDRGCAVVAFDGPAAGRSRGTTSAFNDYVAAAQAVEEALGPFDVYIGHSLGGGVAAQLAARVPRGRRPARVAIMGSFDESEHVFDRYHAMLGLSDRVRAAFDAHVAGLLADPRAAADTPAPTVRDYSNTAAVAGLGQAVAGLIVHDRDDAVSPYAEGVALHEAWPGSRLLTFTGEGHGLKGQRVLDALSRWAVGGEGVEEV